MATIVARRRFSLFFAMIAGAALQPVSAQCTTGFVRGQAIPGTNGDVYAATAQDPDGAGPLPPRLVVGGAFFGAGDQIVENIASFDPATGQWAPLGPGLGTGGVWALTTMQNGDLVAGGLFGYAGTTPVNSVARWNGSTWSPMGNGLPNGVTSLLTMSNGDVIAGGPFTIAAGAPANEVARWNGTTWQPIGTPPPSFQGVYDFLETTTGSLLVASGGGVREWNGVVWSKLGGGTSPAAFSLTQLPNGDILASTATGVMRWNGLAWQSWGPPLATIRTLHALPNGSVLAGGAFAPSVFPAARGIVLGDGTSWLGLAADAPDVHRFVPWPNGDLYAVGTFTGSGTLLTLRVVRWSNGGWSPVGPPCFDQAVSCVTQLANGDVVVGGHFSHAPGVDALRIARWNGTQWSPIGSGFPDGFVAAIAELPNGDLVTAGSFPSLGGAVPGVARWNGVAWTFLADTTGLVGATALAVLPGGDLVAAGQFTSIGGQAASNIARYDGSTWHALGSGITSTSPFAGVASLLVLPNGDLLAAGTFDQAGGVAADGIARWDGTTWSAFGTTTGSPAIVKATTMLANGDIVAIRTNGIARWNGTQWNVLSTGSAFRAVLGLANGALLAAGDFVGVPGLTPLHGVARFDGATWTRVGTTTGYSTFFGAMTALADGSVAVTGAFDAVENEVSPWFARITSTCPASNATFGNGCTGSGGANALRATSLPWIGASWNVRASGLAANSFAVRTIGFTTQQVPLAPVLPLAGVGCDLLVGLDILDVAAATNGVATATLALPDTLPLVGALLHQQMIPFELDALGNVVLITATNGVRGVVGVL